MSSGGGKKQRNLRKKRPLDDDEDGEQGGGAAAGGGEAEVRAEQLADLKLLQKQRRRAPGVDPSKLVPAAAEDEGEANELMDAQYVKAEGTAKSQILDEETHMQRFVERELAKRLGRDVQEGEARLSKQQQEEMELFRLPEGLEATIANEVSLPGSMTAITEVEVSKEAKLAKIEETEAIKARVIAKKTGRPLDGGGGGGMNVRRGQFVWSFGKQQQRKLDVDPQELKEQRRFITDRTRDPKDIAREARRKAQGQGR